MGRDLGRALRAAGLSEDEASCLSQNIEQCKDSLVDWEAVFGSPEMVQNCREALARNCLQYESEYLESCEAMMLEAGMAVPSSE